MRDYLERKDRRSQIAGVLSSSVAGQSCSHLDQINLEVTPSSTEGCSECLKIGSWWVHLRECMICGEVGCCDNSPNRHATKHAHDTGHPIIRSIEPGEHWYWCYVDELAFELSE